MSAADTTAPRRKRWPQKANDLDLEASCQLGCAKAIADLVQILADHGAIEDLAEHTLSVAMDGVRRHIEAAEECYRGVWQLSYPSPSEEVDHVDA